MHVTINGYFWLAGIVLPPDSMNASRSRKLTPQRDRSALNMLADGFTPLLMP